MNSREIARAVAEREQGRRRLNATTMSVSFASVAVTGALIAVLPGATHATVKDSGTSGTSSPSSSSSAGSSVEFVHRLQQLQLQQLHSNSSPNLQTPSNPPSQSFGGGESSTSGGT